MLCSKEDKRVTVKIPRHNFKKKRWSRDEDHSECFKCRKAFNLFRRRHHCRVCGHIFCAKCCPKSSQRDPPLAEGSDLERICDKCFDDTKKRTARPSSPSMKLVKMGRNSSVVTVEPTLTAYKSYAKEVFAAQQKKLVIKLNKRIENLTDKTIQEQEKMSHSKLLLAAIAQCNEEYDRSMELLKEHLALVEKWWGNSDLRVATTLSRMATLGELVVSSNTKLDPKEKRVALRKARELARVRLERALNIVRKIGGTTSPSEEDILNQISLVEFKGGRAASAKRWR